MNVDTIKLTGENLTSVHKPVDAEEERLFAKLYKEAVALSSRRRVTRSRRRVTLRLRTTTPSSSTLGEPQRYTRRGSGSSSMGVVTHEEDSHISDPEETREPDYDDEGNVLTDGDYGESSDSDYAPYDDMHEASDQEEVF